MDLSVRDSKFCGPKSAYFLFVLRAPLDACDKRIIFFSILWQIKSPLKCQEREFHSFDLLISLI